MKRIRAAVVQMNSSAAIDRNLDLAEKLVREAAEKGAELIVLPEKWNLLGSGAELRAGAEPLDGRSLTAACRWASELRITLLAGSIGERLEGAERFANSSVLIDREGEIVATYRKLHMFDVEAGGVTYRESEHEQPGEEAVLAGLGELGLGMTICYDLRFPELYASLAAAGAKLITVPSAFTAATGRDHWEVLLRARAIETQCFMIAANQVGEAPPHYDSWGHSMIVDPWGVVRASLDDGEGIAIADLDLDSQADIRRRLPSLSHRRPGAYQVGVRP